MKIEFYYKDDHSILKGTDDLYFVMNNEVYKDNMKGYESQESLIMFDDFILRCPFIGWRVINE